MYVFDGKTIAKKLGEDLKVRLSKKGIKPKLVSIVVGNDKGALFYQKLKKKRAGEVGIEVEIVKLEEDVKLTELIEQVKNLNGNNSVNGIMLQIPLPGKFTKADRDKIINSIAPEKDVDGMRGDSNFDAPVVRAVMIALAEADKIVRPTLRKTFCKVVVLGHTGFEGKLIYKRFEEKKDLFGAEIELIGVDKRTINIEKKLKIADVIISATGVPGLVQAVMIKEGVVLIDVGAPRGDIDKSAYKKAYFISPVPGGIGPLTIYYLLDNLVDATK